MRFVLAVHGTRGDVEPCAAVGLELQRRDHDVHMAVAPNMVDFVGSAGLAAVRYGPDSQQQLSAASDFIRNVVRIQHPRNIVRAVKDIYAQGWAGMSGAAVNAIVAPWFERKRGMAVSLAMNGASAGGVLLVPLWTVLIARMGFARAALVVVGLMLALLWPFVALCLLRGPEAIGLRPDGVTVGSGASPAGAGSGPPAPRAAMAPLSRAALLRSLHFWSVSGTFAFALLAQVGFLTHQLTFLNPALGLERAALAVSLTTIAAIVGRVGTGFFIDRIDRRVATACNLAVQAAALALMLVWPSPAMLFIGSALYGLGVGNMVTFPSLIVQVEFPRESFNQVVGLVLAVNQFTFAFGPGILGWARDRWGSYDAALLLCIAWELAAAVVVLLGMRGARRAAAYC